MTDAVPQSEFLTEERQKSHESKLSISDPWLKALVLGLSRMRVGRLSLELPDGKIHEFGSTANGGPAARAVVHDVGAIRRIFKYGDIGLGESYMDGQWSSPDLTALIELALLNEDSLSHAFFGKWIAGLGNFVRHFMSRNTKTGSRRNITYHYDLGNDFYSEWLDKSMTYSSALFEHEGQSLIEAQENKYCHIARLADVKENDRVLEIGCGWGGFAEVATKDFGAKVEGITLSDEQLAFAQNRIKEQGLENRAQFHLRDYRDQRGRFDAIVSIEMFEAVGQENWDTYFQTLKRNLKENGKAVVQVITIDEGRFDKYRKTVDFIQRYIFPGGLLPSKTAFIEAASQNGLTAKMTTEFGGDYAETLRLWREEFHAKWETIAELGFDERFKRMWEFYLQYCEAGFRQKSIDVAIFEIK